MTFAWRRVDEGEAGLMRSWPCTSFVSIPSPLRAFPPLRRGGEQGITSTFGRGGNSAGSSRPGTAYQALVPPGPPPLPPPSQGGGKEAPATASQPDTLTLSC